MAGSSRRGPPSVDQWRPSEFVAGGKDTPDRARHLRARSPSPRPSKDRSSTYRRRSRSTSLVRDDDLYRPSRPRQSSRGRSQSSDRHYSPRPSRKKHSPHSPGRRRQPSPSPHRSPLRSRRIGRETSRSLSRDRYTRASARDRDNHYSPTRYREPERSRWPSPRRLTADTWAPSRRRHSRSPISSSYRPSSPRRLETSPRRREREYFDRDCPPHSISKKRPRSRSPEERRRKHRHRPRSPPTKGVRPRSRSLSRSPHRDFRRSPHPSERKHSKRSTRSPPRSPRAHREKRLLDEEAEDRDMSYSNRAYPTRGGTPRASRAPYDYPEYAHSPTYPPQQGESPYGGRNAYSGHYAYASYHSSPTHPYPPPAPSPYRQNTYPPAPSPGYFPPPPPQAASPYAPPPPSSSSYNRQAYSASYDRDYNRGGNHGSRYSPPPDRRASGSSSTGHHASSQTNRGRGTFTNLSWTPSTGNRGGVQQPPRSRREKATDRSPEQEDEDDNPFRPSKDLQSEDQSVKETKEQSSKTSSRGRTPPPPIEIQTDNKVKFSLKSKPPTVRSATSAEFSQGSRDVFVTSKAKPSMERRNHSHHRSPKYDSRDEYRYSDHRRDDYRRDERSDYRYDDRSDYRSSRHDDYRESRRSEKRYVKRIKPRPTLPDELAASDSVYFRKPGSESVVGSGTYGKVYKAIHVYTGNRVALKKIRMDGERDGFPVTAIREVKLLQSLHSSHIVRLLEVMVERNDCYMVFEYLSHDLTGLLNHPSFVLTPAHKKHLSLQLFQGLDYLHHRGVLHRDIKAANILVSNTGQLKLADFGLARFYAKRRQLDYTNRVITIWYRSPELLLGETQYGPAVDIWSAACVLVEIFTRHAIFPGDGGEINQLDRIYAVLGTPTRTEWPGIVDLAWFELLRPSERKQSTFAEKYKNVFTPAAFDLLASMFAFDPTRRPSATEVLDHPYFTSEDPLPLQAHELEGLEGDWHEFESKALRREKERLERESRKEREREDKERKRVATTNGDALHDAKRPRHDEDVNERQNGPRGLEPEPDEDDKPMDEDSDGDGLLEISAIE